MKFRFIVPFTRTVILCSLGRYVYCKILNEKLNRKRTKLTDLPNELLVDILSCIPESILLRQVSLVNHRLEGLSSLACAQRRVLGINCGIENCLNKDIPNCGMVKIVKFVNLTPEKCLKIVQIYPNVRSLSLYLKVDRLDCTPQLDLALTDTLLDNDRWCAQLKSFQLTIHLDSRIPQKEGYEENVAKSIRYMIGLINRRMSSVRKLMIHTSVSLGTEQLHMPIIGQLDYFSFDTDDFTDFIYPSLIKYGACASSPLKLLELSTAIQTEDRMVNLIMDTAASAINRLHINEEDIQNQLSLLSKLPSLTLYGSPLSELERLGDFFSPQVLTNVNKLTIYWQIHDPLVHLIKALGPLTQDVTQSKLDKLIIFFRTDDPEFLDHSALDLSELVGLEGVTSQLRSIGFVRVEFPYQLRSHDEVRQLHFDLICPNLVKVAMQVRFEQCKRCEDEHIDGEKCKWWMVERYAQLNARSSETLN